MWKILIRIMGVALAVAVVFAAYKTWPIVEMRWLQKKAETACLCERRDGPAGRQACWAGFEKAIAPKHAIALIGNQTFCGNVTEAHRDWTEGGQQRRLVTHYLAPGPRERHVTLCTLAEVDRVEAAINRDIDGPAGRVSDATLTLAEDIALGREPGQTSDGPSCF
ncbi:MAG: hypothetical protein V4472_26430 [Pseudomonadota bacterium]